jgi:hypothetical protein
MKHLTKAQVATRDELIAALRGKDKAIDDAIIEINNKIDEVNVLIEENLKPAIDDYNGALGDLEELRNEIVGQMDDYVNARSEKWSNSDAGSNYSSWKDEWEGIDMSPLDDIEPLAHLEASDPAHANEFEALSSEVQED